MGRGCSHVERSVIKQSPGQSTQSFDESGSGTNAHALEILQHVHPELSGLQLMDQNGVGHERMSAPIAPRVRWVIIKQRLLADAVLRLAALVEPIARHAIFGVSTNFGADDRALADPLHQIPRDHVPHASHVAVVGIVILAGEDVAVVEIGAGLVGEGCGEVVDADVGIVVHFHDVVEADIHGGDGGKEPPGLAFVHILLHVQHDDVAVMERFQAELEALGGGLGATDDEADGDARGRCGLHAVR